MACHVRFQGVACLIETGKAWRVWQLLRTRQAMPLQGKAPFGSVMENKKIHISPEEIHKWKSDLPISSK